MARSVNPHYSQDMQSYPIPDNDSADVQPDPMIDWASPMPGEPTFLIDALTGDSMTPGQPFVRRVGTSGQNDVPDGKA